MKKKYSVNVHFDMVISVDVIANSIEEAEELAQEEAESVPITDAECVDIDICVTHVENL